MKVAPANQSFYKVFKSDLTCEHVEKVLIYRQLVALISGSLPIYLTRGFLTQNDSL